MGVPPKSIRARSLRASFAILAATSFLLALADSARAQDGLKYSQSYLVTGDYQVAGVDLLPQSGSGGLVTGTIEMSGVPANADIIAAYLY